MEKIIASITQEIKGKIYEVYPYSKTTAISDKDNNNLQNILDNKVDKEVGKELISKEEVERLSNITEYDDSNIINTLNNKVDKVDGKDLSSNDFTDDLKSKIATSYSKEELDSKFSTKANASSLANKVDKVDGKGLSSNDFTDDLKTNYDSSYENTHSHSNKSTIDKLSESNDGKLQYNGVTIDGSGSTISVDSELSSSSENPVQNKVIYQSLTNKVDKLSGKDLSTNDFTDDLKDKIETLYSKDELDSKFSTKANASSLANKVDKVVGKDLISITEIDRLIGVTNYDDTDINNALSNKVDKLVGKDLSSNDFTDELKDKIDLIDVSSDGTKYLSNDGTYKVISSGSNVTVDTDLSTTSENPVQNKVINNTLDTKVDKIEGKSLISDTEIERLSTINNYDDTEIKNSLTNKVDTVAGKSLSTNDLTNELKESYDNTVNNSHTHTNKEIVDKFSEDSNGKLLYNSESIKSENSDIQVNFTESTNFKKNSNPAVEFNIDSSLPSKNELNVSYNYNKKYSYSGFGPKEEANASISDITFRESGYDKFFTKQANNKFLVIAPFTASIQCGVIQSPMDSNYAKGSFFINDVKVAEYSGRHLYPGEYKTLTHDFVAGDTFFCYTNDNNDNPQQYCIFTIPQDEKISTTTHNHINKDMIDKLSYDTTSNRLKYNDINIIAEVDVSAENNNAVVKKSDGLYVTDKSIDIDNINTKINVLSTIKNVDYSKPRYCYLYTDITVTTSISVGYIIPFDIVGENNGFELNSTNHSVKLIAGIPYKISCDIPITGSAGYMNISIYNLTLDKSLTNFSKIASNFNGTSSDSSASIIYTPDVDSEIQIKVFSSSSASLNTSSYHGHLIVEEIGMNSFINPVKYIDSAEGLEDTPIGTVISYMGKTVPNHYLACDGATYNITDYPYLSQFIEDEFGSISYFGGDGITTFSVPNLQGEFLRGTGTNFSTGADVGLHQDASGVQNFYTDSGTSIDVLANSGSGYSNDNYDSIIETATSAVKLAGTTSTAYNGQVKEYTTRPSNTSVLYCIKYEPTYYMQVSTSTDYKVLWEGKVYSKNSTIELSESFKNYDQLILCGEINYSIPGINKCQFSILTSDIEPSTICDEYIFFWYANKSSNKYSSLHFTSNTEMIIDTVTSNSSTTYGAFTKIVGIKY